MRHPTPRRPLAGLRVPRLSALLLALLPLSGPCAAEANPEANLFPAQSFAPPKPPPAPRVIAPPAEPPVPALPYTYLGQLTDRGEITLLLARAGRTLVARVGDTLDGQYRLERITPQRAEFTFLPRDSRQTLTLRVQP
jgi:hypothetical protein